MLNISGNNITITKGDTGYINLKIKSPDGTSYHPAEGDIVRCQVRETPDSEEVLIEGEITITHKIVWHIKPSDTNELDLGTYSWDAELEKENGDIFTFIPHSDFIVTEEVTRV